VKFLKKGYIYSALSAVFFGSAGLIVKLAYAEGSDSIELLTIQYIIAVILMFLIIALSNKKAFFISGNHLFHTAILGIVGNTFMTVFYYLAFSYLQVSMVALLLYTYPIMVFIYCIIFQKEAIDRNKFCSLILAFIGCFLALGFTKDDVRLSFVGIICGLLSAVFYAFMNIYSEKKLREVNPLSINFYSTTFSLISLIAFRFPWELIQGKFSIKLIGYTAVLALICEIIPLTLLYSAIKYIGALKVSIIGNLEIPTAMILSYIFLKEAPTFLQVAGATMVVYSIYRIKK
jgi:drug/metabolite transporter (DMT)-like permease